MRLSQAFVKQYRGFWNQGKGQFQPREFVRNRALNVTALLISVAFIAPLALMLSNGDMEWRDSGKINLWLLVALLPTLFAHRFGYVAKFLYFCVWLFVFTCIQASFGRVNGTHIPLLAVPAMVLFFLGPNRWRLALMLTALAAVLFVLIEYLVPWQVAWGYRFLDAIRNEIPSQIVLGIHDLAFVSVVIVTEAIIFIGAYLTLSALQKSEQLLAGEYARSEMLLSSMLPLSIANKLKDNPNATIADKYSDVSILFSDMVGFTAYSSDKPAEEVVATLNALFLGFDKLVDEYGLEKIKTVGDAYMVAGGLDIGDDKHPSKMAELALQMIDLADKHFEEYEIDMALRIGIHRGPAVAGVVGNKRPFYDVWGDTVNVASRMESTASPGAIQVTRELMQILGDEFSFTRGNDVMVKGKGEMERYTLTGRTQQARF